MISVSASEGEQGGVAKKEGVGHNGDNMRARERVRRSKDREGGGREREKN